MFLGSDYFSNPPINANPDDIASQSYDLHQPIVFELQLTELKLSTFTHTHIIYPEREREREELGARRRRRKASDLQVTQGRRHITMIMAIGS